MTAILVGTAHFTGTGKVFGRDSDGLAAALRGALIDNARAKISTAAITDFTDSTTGVNATAVVDLTIPTAVFDASSSGGATRTDFNTAIGKFENAGAVMANWFNEVRARLGLPLMTWASGTISTAGTLAAMDLSVATTSGATSLNYESGAAAMLLAKQNQRKLVRSFNQIMVALGMTPISDAMTGPFGYDFGLVAIADADADGDGSTAISKAVADAFLDSLADNMASLAAYWDNTMNQAGLSDLTDNSGGTAAADTIAAINQAFTAHQDSATNSAPAAALNTELPKIENNFADLASRVNALRRFHGLSTVMTDSTGGTANTTLEVIDDTLTAVDGTGTDTASKATADVTFGEIADNFATLASAINDLTPIYGMTDLTDSSGGTADTDLELVALTDTTGVDNSAAATGVADADMDAALDVVTDNLATMAAKLNLMTGVEVESVPLHAVAAA
jgi:hypothetical protein